MHKTKEAMSNNLIITHSEETLVNAYRLMREQNIRHLPVVDEGKFIVGILSDRDIVRAMNVKKSSHFQQDMELSEELIVKNFMSWPVYTVGESTSLMRTAEEMLKQKVSAFLVEDENSNIKGIITSDDILKVFILDEKREENIGLRSVGFFFSGPNV